MKTAIPSFTVCSHPETLQVSTVWFDKDAVFQQAAVLLSFGRQGSVCKVKPESCYGDKKDSKVEMDSDVHGYCGDSLTDTIQHLLYAEAQPAKAGNNGGFKATGELGEGVLESLHLQLPQLS